MSKKTIQKYLFALLGMLALSSCLEHEAVIHLEKDGSGQIVETTFFGEQILQMEAMAGKNDKMSMGGSMLNPKPETLKERAVQMGEGVEYLKQEKIEEGGKKGLRITYGFKDINQLRYGLNSGISGFSKDEKNKQEFTFKFDQNKLSVVLPEMKNPDAKKKETDPAEAAMAKQMMAGVKLAFKLNFKSGIKKSNASFQDGNTLTLAEIDMDKIIKSPKGFETLENLENEGWEGIKKANKEVDGFKMEAEKKLTIEVQ